MEAAGESPVDVGHALFSLHDPHVGHERAFNRYYERDHLYAAAVMAPWTIAGARWVATKPLKDLRYPAAGPFGPSHDGSYLTMFWIQAGRLDEQQAWVSGQMKELVAAGRVFDHRSVQTATAYDHLGTWRRDPDGVPPFMALDHRYPGLVWMVLERRDDRPLPAFAQALRDEILPGAFAGTPVALASLFAPRPKEPWWPAAAPEVPGVGQRVFIAAFLETAPAAVWNDLFAGFGGTVDATGHGRTLLVAPFVPTVPGTDTYADELW